MLASVGEFLLMMLIFGALLATYVGALLGVIIGVMALLHELLCLAGDKGVVRHG